MKNSSRLWKKTLFTALVLASIQGTLQASTPIEKRVPITHVYTPKGFDNNDRTEIVVTGYLPNLCHRYPQSTVAVVGDKIKVEVTSLYYEPNNYFCAQMLVPFEQVVKVGVLEKGNYKIEVNGGLLMDEKSMLLVQESTSNALDEHVYASVDNVIKDEANDKVILSGYNPSDCYVLDEVKSVSNGSDTYSVLPVMKQVYSFCPMKMIPFKIEYNVPNTIQRDEVLLHVRSMDGNALNTIYRRPNN